MSIGEKITTKQQWYDLNKYKDEIQSFVLQKKNELDVTSQMSKTNDILYRICYAGGTESDIERFPHAAETFRVYKAAIIESSLSGYSALLEATGRDGYSVLQSPKVKQVMTEQFKGMSLLEKLSGDTLDDWCFKGEAVAYIKLKETTENYRVKQTLEDPETGEKIMSFSIKQGVTYQDLEVERIDPLDFFVDAIDYGKDPIGCAKIIRQYIDSKTLLSSDAYPLLSHEDKIDIINKSGKNGIGKTFFNWQGTNSTTTYNKTDKDQIEVYIFDGDYITNDNKLLSNIHAVVVNNRIASVRYNTVSSQRIIYACYKMDRQTHRGISPLACTMPVNNLINKVTDLFIKNLEDTSDPWLLWSKGSFSSQQAKEARRKKELEYNSPDGAKPEFWMPPPTNPTGLQLMELILTQNKNVLGLNNYLSGDTTGSVRTAEESAILFQKANARMRVETDVFSYRFMLPLFVSFYAFNRELALAYNNALDPIYKDPKLKISISTNASKADREGELQRLMSMLNLPIAQMIFSNLNPEQTVLAVRYLMAKAQLTDGDNLLQLINSNGETQVPQEGDEDAAIGITGEEANMPTQDIPMTENIDTNLN
jgi:hypothetical protein